MSAGPRDPMAPYIVLITGASSGIGHAAAQRFAAEPATELVLVARREEILSRLVEELPCPASFVAADITGDDAPRRIREHVESTHGRLDVLVNNAGAAWRGTFADSGWKNARRHMELNFDAQLRITEELLPLLRASAPSSIVNVASTAGRVARAGSGAYSASKFAFAGWSDALYQEEHANGVHVGLVMPGFIRTEGFPAEELREKALTRWMVSDVGKVADAIYDVGVRRKAERYVPRPYALAAAARTLAPGLLRLAGRSGASSVLTTKTRADETDAGAGSRPGS